MANKKYAKYEFLRCFNEIGNNPFGFKTMFETAPPTNYNKHFCEFVSERDFPMTELECICTYKKVINAWPNESEVKAMKPDSDSSTQDYRNEQIADYNSIYK